MQDGKMIALLVVLRIETQQLNWQARLSLTVVQCTPANLLVDVICNAGMPLATCWDKVKGSK